MLFIMAIESVWIMRIRNRSNENDVNTADEIITEINRAQKPEPEDYIFRVAVLDDNDEVLERVCKLSERYFTKANRLYDIQKYNNPQWLLTDLKDHDASFDLFLVDIEMGAMDGRQFVTEARMIMHHAYYVFVTAHAKYAIEGYRYGIFRYVYKPEMALTLPEALEAVCRSIDEDKPVLYTIHARKCVVTVVMREIRYIRYKDKKSCFYVGTDEEAIEERITLAEIYEKLDKNIFVQTDRAYIVNLRYIRSLDAETLELTDGTRIPVSRRRKSDVLNRMVAMN